jgi:tetratricopeptide (TPR) repeat protein
LPLIALALAGFLLFPGCGDPQSPKPQAGVSGETATNGTAPSTSNDPRLEVGKELLGKGRLAEAGMIFDTVVNEHPEMARANFYKGLVLHQGQSHTSALSWYKAAEVSPQSFKERDTLSYYMGWCNFYAGNIDASRVNIEAFLLETPDRSDAHFLAGLIALEQSRLSDAKASLQRAIELSNGDPENERSMARAWIRLADVYSNESDFPAALEAVDRALELRPLLNEIWFRKYMILMRLGRDEDANFARKRWKDLSLNGGETLESDS